MIEKLEYGKILVYSGVSPLISVYNLHQERTRAKTAGREKEGAGVTESIFMAERQK